MGLFGLIILQRRLKYIQRGLEKATKKAGERPPTFGGVLVLNI
jgi:hypothetical protein